MPSQKWGIDIPIKEMNVQKWSMTVFGRAADKMPQGNAISKATRKEPNASSNVAGSRSAIKSFTLVPSTSDWPKFPCRTFPSQWRYWMSKG